MAETTGISWTDATWNPWMGCTKVSPGCDNCYMFRDMRKYGRNPDVVQRTGPATFNAPLKWKEPRLIFTCSWSDFFHHGADAWREEAWDIMTNTPQHTYQVLTKRPGLMVEWARMHGWPNHIWAGTSVESQKYVPRLDVLTRVPAKVRFVSLEPLLGPVELGKWLRWEGNTMGQYSEFDAPPIPPVISWVIVGGESGPDHREMDMAWLLAIDRQCYQVPLWVKQDSGSRPGQQGRIPNRIWLRKERPECGATWPKPPEKVKA